jgi:hypothetical protein
MIIQRLNERHWEDVVEKVSWFFKHDQHKVIRWLNYKNPVLGGLAPIDFKAAGRARKLSQIVDSLLEGNVA